MNFNPIWRVRFFAILFAVAFSSGPAISQQKTTDAQKVDVGALVKEIMSVQLDGSDTQLAIWMPFDFFVAAGMSDGTQTKAGAEKNLRFLKPYHTIIVSCAFTNDNGAVSHATEAEVRARAIVKLDSGEEVKPLDKVPALVSATVEAMKAGMAAQTGGAGAGTMHVLLFPATSEKGTELIDTSKKGKLTFLLKADKNFKETTFAWRTPFDATTPTPPCAKCKETVSPKWTFCPWCGANLEKK